MASVTGRAARYEKLVNFLRSGKNTPKRGRIDRLSDLQYPNLDHVEDPVARVYMALLEKSPLHVAEMTLRTRLDFDAVCDAVSGRPGAVSASSQVMLLMMNGRFIDPIANDREDRGGTPAWGGTVAAFAIADNCPRVTLGRYVARSLTAARRAKLDATT